MIRGGVPFLWGTAKGKARAPPPPPRPDGFVDVMVRHPQHKISDSERLNAHSAMAKWPRAGGTPHPPTRAKSLQWAVPVLHFSLRVRGQSNGLYNHRLFFGGAV